MTRTKDLPEILDLPLFRLREESLVIEQERAYAEYLESLPPPPVDLSEEWMKLGPPEETLIDN